MKEAIRKTKTTSISQESLIKNKNNAIKTEVSNKAEIAKHLNSFFVRRQTSFKIPSRQSSFLNILKDYKFHFNK